MRLRSSMPRIVSGENSIIPDMFHGLFGGGHPSGMTPAMFCQTATIYAVDGRGKAGIPLPVQFVTSPERLKAARKAADRPSVERRQVARVEVQRP
jgi:hypothetical protein